MIAITGIESHVKVVSMSNGTNYTESETRYAVIGCTTTEVSCEPLANMYGLPME